MNSLFTYFTRLLVVSLFFSGIYFNEAEAQVLPPNLICVTNDTLQWEIPINTCGNFNAYRIFGSQSPTGPFAEIATIADPFETLFFHQAAGANIWYYYMETDADCMGHPTLQSDTLDNLIPLAGEIAYVTVNGNMVELAWNPSPSPEVFAYIISKETNMGTSIIDTVYTGTSYFDFDVIPEDRVESYFVTAIDRCGNASLVTNPHNTILLDYQNNGGCERYITLNWNAYQNWSSGLEKYNIYVSTDGGDYELAGSTASGITTFDLMDVSENSIYCFYIEAVENTTGITSRSNQICTSIDLVQPVTGLAFVNAKSISDNELQFSWVWDVNSTLTQTDILISTDMTNFSYLENYPIDLPLTNANSLIVQENTFTNSPTYYQIQTTDSCGVVMTSNTIGMVYLSGYSSGEAVNSLEWTPYVNELLDTVYYELFRLSTNVPERIATVAGDGTFSYTDLIDLSDPSQLESCYYIVARGTVTLPDGTILETASFSNTVCVFQNANLYIPNAFAPDGVNQIFKPILQFGNPRSYSMVIYDRWGGLVFQSEDIGQGWNGEKNGTPMPQGVYIFHIEMTKDNGEIIKKTGTVALIK